MNHLEFRKVGTFLVIALMAAISMGFAQEKQKMTVEWLYSDEAAEISSLPRYEWLQNGTAIYLDSRKPAVERTFEILDPQSGKRTSVLDMAKALKDLQKYLGKEGAPSVLPWPDSFDARARRAVYTLGGDVYLLDTATSQFVRVTDTEPAEIGTTFSPDGEKIAYVRDHDVYVYDLPKKTERAITTNGSETLWNGRLTFMYGEDVFNGQVVGLWWSPDSEALAYIQTDVSDVTEFWYYDIKSFHPRVIKQRYPLVGEKIETVRIAVCELSSGKSTWAECSGRPDEYIVHVDWLPDSQRLAVQALNRDQDLLDLYFVERASGKATPILRETDPAWVNCGDDLYFLGDGKRFIWGSERDGYKHLYLYALDGKLLIIHGTLGHNAPFSETVKMMDAFMRAGKQVDNLILAEQSHVPQGDGHKYWVKVRHAYFKEHLLGVSELPGQEKKPAIDSQIAPYIGDYDFQGYSVPVLSKDGKSLTMIVPGQPEFQLVLDKGNLYTISNAAGFSVEFLVDEAGKVTGLKLIQPGGESYTLKKK